MIEDKLEKTLQLHGYTIQVHTKKYALQLANYKCFWCEKTPVDAYLGLYFIKEESIHYIMCPDCFFYKKRHEQLSSYLRHLKEESREHKKELSKINNYIIKNRLVVYEDEILKKIPNQEKRE